MFRVVFSIFVALVLTSCRSLDIVIFTPTPMPTVAPAPTQDPEMANANNQVPYESLIINVETLHIGSPNNIGTSELSLRSPQYFVTTNGDAGSPANAPPPGLRASAPTGYQISYSPPLFSLPSPTSTPQPAGSGDPMASGIDNICFIIPANYVSTWVHETGGLLTRQEHNRLYRACHDPILHPIDRQRAWETGYCIYQYLTEGEHVGLHIGPRCYPWVPTPVSIPPHLRRSSGSSRPASSGGSSPPASNSGSSRPASNISNDGYSPPASNDGYSPPASNGGSSPYTPGTGSSPYNPPNSEVVSYSGTTWIDGTRCYVENGENKEYTGPAGITTLAGPGSSVIIPEDAGELDCSTVKIGETHNTDGQPI